MSARRSLHELLVPNDSAWPIVQAWIQGAANTVEVLPPDPDLRGRALEEVQVRTRSPIGAIVYETGGIFIDHGWLRILGSGHQRIRRSLPEWNRGRSVSADGRRQKAWILACRRRRDRRILCLEWRCVWAGDRKNILFCTG